MAGWRHSSGRRLETVDAGNTHLMPASGSRIAALSREEGAETSVGRALAHTAIRTCRSLFFRHGRASSWSSSRTSRAGSASPRVSSFVASSISSGCSRHLGANDVLQTATLVTLCEGYIGLLPYIKLWFKLFYLKQQGSAVGVMSD